MNLFYARFPVESHVSKKNNRPIFNAGKNPFIGKSQKLRDAELHMTARLKMHMRSLNIQTIHQDVEVTFTFYFANYYVDGRRSKRIPDLSNLIQLPEDCLVQAGILGDDQQIASYDGTRRVPSDRNEIEIVIKRFVK